METGALSNNGIFKKWFGSGYRRSPGEGPRATIKPPTTAELLALAVASLGINNAQNGNLKEAAVQGFLALTIGLAETVRRT